MNRLFRFYTLYLLDVAFLLKFCKFLKFDVCYLILKQPTFQHFKTKILFLQNFQLEFVEINIYLD